MAESMPANTIRAGISSGHLNRELIQRVIWSVTCLHSHGSDGWERPAHNGVNHSCLWSTFREWWGQVATQAATRSGPSGVKRGEPD